MSANLATEDFSDDSLRRPLGSCLRANYLTATTHKRSLEDYQIVARRFNAGYGLNAGYVSIARTSRD